MGLDEYYNNMSDTRSIINVVLVFVVLFHILRLATLLRITPSGDRLQLTFYTYIDDIAQQRNTEYISN